MGICKISKTCGRLSFVISTKLSPVTPSTPRQKNLAYHTALRVEILSENFLEIHVKNEALTSALKSDLEDIFARVSLVEPSPPPQTTSSYIELAYGWLLSNLHNPYPQKEARDDIAYQTGAPRKDIDAWFTDARKRIGWNRLRKVRFGNKRTAIIDAATRFFSYSDPKRPLDPSIELEFAAIESRATELYSEKFVQTTLASKLDVAVKDMTPALKLQAKVETQQRRTERRRGRDALAYPSPERSPRTSPERSPRISPERSPMQSRKRCADSCDDDEALPQGRPMKKARLEPSTPLQDFGATSLPSPAASLDEVSDNDSSGLPLSVGKRKRRLSVGDIQHAPKRPRSMHIALRPQAVSDPLPVSHASPSFDDWYQNTFTTGDSLGTTIPPAVTVEAPDATAPLEIEIYNFSSNDRNTRSSPPNPITPPTSVTEVDPQVPTGAYVISEENSLSWFDLNNCGVGNSVSPERVITMPGTLIPTYEVPPFDLDCIASEKIGSTDSLPSFSFSEWDHENFFQCDIPSSQLCLDVTCTPVDPVLFVLSPESQKEVKQRELLAVQNRLLSLQAELAATP